MIVDCEAEGAKCCKSCANCAKICAPAGPCMWPSNEKGCDGKTVGASLRILDVDLKGMLFARAERASAASGNGTGSSRKA